MLVCANMHDINANNYVIHTHIYASFTSTYDNTVHCLNSPSVKTFPIFPFGRIRNV